MKYKLEVICSAMSTQNIYVDTLEEVLEQKELTKERLKQELEFKEKQHKEVYDCDGSCSSFLHEKARHQVKFKIYLAKWEVIG